MLFAAGIAAIFIFVIVLYLSWYFYTTHKNSLGSRSSDIRMREQAFHVISFVESLKRACPVGIRRNWVLVKSATGSPRCWKRSSLLQPLRNCKIDLEIYGTSVVIKGSSLETLRMVANTSKWAEWRPDVTPRTYKAQLFDDPTLRKDSFMHSTKIVSKEGSLEFYRFSYLSMDNLGWVLFWNVKKVDWSFFLVQPLFKSDLDCCMLTYIFGSYPILADGLAVKLLISSVNGIKDAVEMNSVHAVPVCFPFSSTSVKHSMSPKRTSMATHCNSRIEPNRSSAGTYKLFKLLPPVNRNQVIVKSFQDYTLCLDVCQDELNESEVLESSEKISSNCAQDEVRHISEVPRSKSSSIPGLNRVHVHQHVKSSSFPEAIHSLGFNNEYSQLSGQVNEFSNLVRKRYNTISFLHETAGKSSKRVEQNCFSDDNIHSRKLSSTMTNDTKSLENLSECEEDISCCDESDIVDKIHSSAEDNSLLDCLSDSLEENLSHAANLEFEILLPDIDKTAQRLTEITTYGNYGLSEIQAEVLEASGVSLQTYIEDQPPTSRGWFFHSTYKGVTVLSKTATTGHLNVLSYACKTEIDAKILDVWKMVKNPNSRFICDETVKKVKVLEEISNDQKVIHTYHESHHLLKTEAIDFCLLHTERQEHSKYYLAIQSIEYENCPLMDAITRGILLPSGWVLWPATQNHEKTTVIFLCQLLVSNPGSLFLQDLSHSVPLYLYNLKKYMMLQPS